MPKLIENYIFMQPKHFFSYFISECLIKSNGSDGVEDSEIIQLYFARNERAVEETSKNIEIIVLGSLITFCLMLKIRKNVLTIPFLVHGKQYRRSLLQSCPLFWGESHEILL